MILKRKSILKSSSFKIIKNEKKKKKNHILVMLDKWAFFFSGNYMYFYRIHKYRNQNLD